MDLLQFNHWWRDGFLRKELVGRKRKILPKLISFLPKRQILLLKGLRKVGKTTLIYQLIGHLINEGVSPLISISTNLEQSQRLKISRQIT
jgi:hypothetical protein